MNWLDLVAADGLLRWLLAGLLALAATAAAGHALLGKREPRSALGWIAVSVMFPAIGPLLYYVFGINRIRTRAKRLHSDEPAMVRHRLGVGAPPGLIPGQGRVGPDRAVGDAPQTALADLVRLSEVVTQRTFLGGNAVSLLRNGEGAYPAMLDAIARARSTVLLASYIFHSDTTGKLFVQSLADATARGVCVRVLVDGVGERYRGPRISRLLKRANVTVGCFMPPRLVPPQLHVNLRNHRKILTVDGVDAFVGGMNIGDRHLADSSAVNRVVDVHFHLRGPIVQSIECVFLDDWVFVTGEDLEGSGASPATGDSFANVIVDGPNDDVDKLATILLGAVASARERVWIMTPYFLPPRELVAAMKTAVLRGIEVVVVLPGKNNLPYMDWASRTVLWELLQWGVRVYYQPPPFAHAKLLIVDRDYAQFGSANLDPRSLRLNFELVVEVYDAGFVEQIASYMTAKMAPSRLARFEELEERKLWTRLRDACAWLASPYL